VCPAARRQQRALLLERVKATQQESHTLSDYNRRLFQAIVDEQRGPVLPPPTMPSTHFRLQTNSCPTTTTSFYKDPPLTSHTPTNGPTKEGSILYNGSALLHMRNRPSSEPAKRFDHLRGMQVQYPLIQQIMQQSNKEYKVIPTPCAKAARAAADTSFTKPESDIKSETVPSAPPTIADSVKDGSVCFDLPLSPDYVIMVPKTASSSDYFADQEEFDWMDEELPLQASSEKSDKDLPHVTVRVIESMEVSVDGR
jgi:hypothetical protein